MCDLIEKLELDIQMARKTADMAALLEVAGDAVTQLEAAANKTPERSAQTAFLNSAKKIAYNSAADVWPGWEIGMPARSDAQLASAQALAEKCHELTERLDPPAMQRGNAIWLIGAFDLARDRYREAAEQFKNAASAFGNEAEAVLMAQGFWAIATELSGASDQAPDFDAVIKKLTKIPTEDASFFKEQLQSGRRIFVSG